MLAHFEAEEEPSSETGKKYEKWVGLIWQKLPLPGQKKGPDKSKIAFFPHVVGEIRTPFCHLLPALINHSCSSSSCQK